MPHPQPRRPRFERAAVRGMRLTPRDRELLQAVQRHRLLRSPHLAALAGSSGQAVRRRLQLLFHHGYLDRPPMQLDWYARGSEPLVYALGRRGAKALGTPGEVRRHGGWSKTSRLSRPFLRHTLAVADIMVAFELACRRREGVSLIQAEEVLARVPEETRRLRLPFRWHVQIRADGKSHRIGVDPDRVFGLRFKGAPANRREAFFFLEADRGTMPVARKGLVKTSVLRKLLAYRETWRQRVHARRLGIPNFRVLTVTAGRARLAHLVASCRALGVGTSLFFFADRESVCGGDILEQRWLNGRGLPIRLLALTERDESIGVGAAGRMPTL